MGAHAREWIDWLADQGFAIWQCLPLVPPGRGNSPYSTHASCLGNALLIDLKDLVTADLLRPDELPEPTLWTRSNYRQARSTLLPLLQRAARRLSEPVHPLHARWRSWINDQEGLRDAALFRAIQQTQPGKGWWEWPAALRDREPQALTRAEAEHANSLEQTSQIAFLFDLQWQALRAYARKRGVELWGDVPIYVDHDSADVWAHQGLFQLDAAGLPTLMAGVPPDAFSETGQLWQNPVYNWDAMAEDGYQWWITRLTRTLAQCDTLRLDHFRGLESFYAIPQGATDARHGHWLPGPGERFIQAMRGHFGRLDWVAEDLGLVDESVESLRDVAGVPGMRVLQFAFDGDPLNLHLPHRHPAHAIAYSGTHDNNTAQGWAQALDEATRRCATKVLRPKVTASGGLAHALVEATLGSPANTAILQLQDLALLGAEARMNVPGTAEGQWEWRVGTGTWSELMTGEHRVDLARFGRQSSHSVSKTTLPPSC